MALIREKKTHRQAYRTLFDTRNDSIFGSLL